MFDTAVFDSQIKPAMAAAQNGFDQLLTDEAS
jgi:hypothetical protein